MEKKITPQNTYIYDVLFDGKVCRWKKSAIKYHIDYSNLGSYCNKEEYTERIEYAFYCWQKVLNNKLVFEQTRDQKNADITICFRRNQGVGTIGLCEFNNISPNGEFKNINIKIGLISPTKIEQTILHEIGHAIGLYAHSPNENDLMFWCQNKKNMNLSQKDIDTINLLYSLPIGTIASNIESLCEEKLELPLPNKQKISNYKNNNRNLETETKEIAKARLIEFSQQYIDLNQYTKDIIKTFCSNKCY